MGRVAGLFAPQPAEAEGAAGQLKRRPKNAGAHPFARAAQVDNIPAVGAAASTEAAGADTAELIYSGAAAAAREAACSAQEEAKGGCGQGSAGEPSDAVYRDLSAPAAGVGTATAHARESQFLHRWGCNDLVHEALVELGRHRPNPNPIPIPNPNPTPTPIPNPNPNLTLTLALPANPNPR